MKKLLSELAESLRMALDSLAAHKLRSALTLLGVLVGVFSIILVMTAMRAMKNNIEQELGSLGSKTFVMQKMPGAFFGGPEQFMRFLRRKNITYTQAVAFRKKA
ncbi:MAG TPA: ABC transporter permease, partial [Chthoniobacteraceae bacterium]